MTRQGPYPLNGGQDFHPLQFQRPHSLRYGPGPLPVAWDGGWGGGGEEGGGGGREACVAVSGQGSLLGRTESQSPQRLPSREPQDLPAEQPGLHVTVCPRGLFKGVGAGAQSPGRVCTSPLAQLRN